ncbi:hypothetical protein CCUS01_17221 [Colletotrichum cuscutae]|uniref:Uncharacterized protein n=1 Tax=Colletotrichum cuscutae TaxID=1209917 RepID=A0AAI9V6M1_9PEZI|nr:hypothetical protein CCUS01_17221 [Colletotrichum cuscutae]
MAGSLGTSESCPGAATLLPFAPIIRLIAQNGGQIGNSNSSRPPFQKDTDPASDNLACFCITEANDVQRLTACAVADAHPEKENGYVTISKFYYGSPPPTGPIRKKETALTMISRQMRFLLLCHRLVNCIGVSMPCQLSTSPSRTRSGPCLAVKRPGVPRDPFARMPDVHFQGVQTARLVCSSVPSKTPATVRFAGGTVHSGQGLKISPVTIDVQFLPPCATRLVKASLGGLRRIGDSRPRPGPGFAKRALLNLQITTQLNRAAVPTLSLKTGLARALSVGALSTTFNFSLESAGSTKCLGYLSQTLAELTCASIYPPTTPLRRDDGKTGAWIAMFWDGAKTDSRLTIPAARLRAASPPNMLRERQSTSRAWNKDISSETSDGPERASVGLEKSQPDPEMTDSMKEVSIAGQADQASSTAVLEILLSVSGQAGVGSYCQLLASRRVTTSADGVHNLTDLNGATDKLSNYCRLVTGPSLTGPYYGQKNADYRSTVVLSAATCPHQRLATSINILPSLHSVLRLPLRSDPKRLNPQNLSETTCNCPWNNLSEKPSDHKTYPARPKLANGVTRRRHTAGFRERFGGIVIITLRLGDGFIFCDLPWSDDGEWAAKQVRWILIASHTIGTAHPAQIHHPRRGRGTQVCTQVCSMVEASHIVARVWEIRCNLRSPLYGFCQTGRHKRRILLSRRPIHSHMGRIQKVKKEFLFQKSGNRPIENEGQQAAGPLRPSPRLHSLNAGPQDSRLPGFRSPENADLRAKVQDSRPRFMWVVTSPPCSALEHHDSPSQTGLENMLRRCGPVIPKAARATGLEPLHNNVVYPIGPLAQRCYRKFLPCMPKRRISWADCMNVRMFGGFCLFAS